MTYVGKRIAMDVRHISAVDPIGYIDGLQAAPAGFRCRHSLKTTEAVFSIESETMIQYSLCPRHEAPPTF